MWGLELKGRETGSRHESGSLGKVFGLNYEKRDITEFRTGIL